MISIGREKTYVLIMLRLYNRARMLYSGLTQLLKMLLTLNYLDCLVVVTKQ